MSDWKQSTINGGSLKHVPLETGSNGWASPPGNLFNLRDKNYFTKKTKSPSSAAYLLHPVGVDWLKSGSKLDHVLSRADNRVIHALKNENSKTFVLAVNLQVPGCSKIATAILHLALGCVNSVTIDMGFVVEAVEEEELPERLLGAVRICQMEMSSATVVSATGGVKGVTPGGVSSSRVADDCDADNWPVGHIERNWQFNNLPGVDVIILSYCKGPLSSVMGHMTLSLQTSVNRGNVPISASLASANLVNQDIWLSKCPDIVTKVARSN
ncbi:enhanced disease resistance-like protein (DUF1336) [Artemisia annua]|uniref:Enhanced disease resistance-like protein (DUF1336) n=1 Tax=Artemisia annua TaxID=35608 RepID=A0A2U1NFS9_ARTAN|nr:enhanced disease resistance-like protein (DUF1336) [Artemisia annua]